VYTPQPIVNFMVRSVEEILQKEFGHSLGDKGVHILDPFVGTGNFIVNIMDKIKATDLPYKYENELHCNEVMLLPYYIASMNIEHAYFERTGEYSAFPGICLVDTFELAESRQSPLFTEENTQRVERQKRSPIFVVIGNPPYNAWQVNENDNNRNRRYSEVSKWVAQDYGKGSKAANRNALADPYIKAICWGTHRLGDAGILAFVTNSGFLDSIAADAMRKHLTNEFADIFVLDLGGNVRKNPKLSGTTHNVFGIQVGVSINIFVKRPPGQGRRHTIHYARVDELWKKEDKYRYLEATGRVGDVEWKTIIPDESGNWLREGMSGDFARYSSITTLFSSDSNGLKTNRDSWAYNFDRKVLASNIRRTIETYNQEILKWANRSDKKATADDLLINDESRISWSGTLKQHLQAGERLAFDEAKIRQAIYRPFCAHFVYFDASLNERRYQLVSIFPSLKSELENVVISANAIGNPRPFHCLATQHIPDIHLTGDTQCFPFYTYAEDGTHRRENITDWALEQFRSHYHDPSITKRDIFHYIYAVLHHPEYRERYAANLRRELPRIPFVGMHGTMESLSLSHGGAANGSAGLQPWVNEKKENNSALPKAGAEERSPQTTEATTDERRYERMSDAAKDRFLSEWKREQDAGELHYASQDDARVFRAFAKAGQRLAEIHVHYEAQPEYPLTKTEKAGEKLDYRVTKMKLSKDKTSLIYNQFLTLSGIPPETYEYRLGNRSALEWIVDQYQISTDKRSGIVNDPNRDDDPEYILRLIGQVITVSLETVRIVNSLPQLINSQSPEASPPASQL
ncbi:MAG: type ISP restriction/modification enzyme, partial [Terriglobales bacterium]